MDELEGEQPPDLEVLEGRFYAKEAQAGKRRVLSSLRGEEDVEEEYSNTGDKEPLRHRSAVEHSRRLSIPPGRAE